MLSLTRAVGLGNMKQIIVRTALLAVLTAASAAVAGGTNGVVKMSVRPIHFKPKTVPREVFIGTNTNAIRTVAELKTRIAELPKGSILHWYSGCFLYRFVPVGTNRIDRATFSKMCEDAGVQFSYSCGF